MGYVLKFCGWYPSRIDSLSGDFVQRHAIAISKHIKTVVLFAQKDPGLKGNKVEQVVFNNGNLYEYIYYYPKKSWLDKLWSQYYYLRILKSFLPFLIKAHGKPDFVHVNIVWRAILWALYVNWKFKWPFVITENSTEYQVNAFENIRKKSSWRKLITRKAFEKCELFIPVSKQLGETLNELYGSVPYKVVPNAVDTNLFYYYNPEGNRPGIPRLLHISTLGYQKNIEGILKVLLRLSKTSLPFEVIMVGPELEMVKNFLDKNEILKKCVTITGPLTYKNVASLMQTADCLFLFSRYENLPCVILEAHCCGLPVITTDVGGIPEIITSENGLMLPSEDKEALFIALINMVEGKLHFDRQAIANKAKQLYNYDTVGAMYFEIYKKQFPFISKHDPAYKDVIVL
ncbi:MAG: glycosyltransferase [Bacteroidota bacterium]